MRAGRIAVRRAPVVTLITTTLVAAAPAAEHGGSVRVAHQEGPPPGHTGGFGEPTCAACHEDSPVNAPGGSVRIEGIPARFESGASYVLTVVLESEDMVHAGFQLSARFAEGRLRGGSAGAMAALDGRVAVVSPPSAGVRYAQHSLAGSQPGDPVLATWMVQWTAPEGVLPVVFHAAANSANGDNSPLGDLVYAHEARAIPRSADSPSAGRY